MHVAPSGLHWVMHVPCAQTPLQHSLKFMHEPPFGWQGGAQMPPEQFPEQQFGPLAHIWPFGTHIIPQFAPQRFTASCTQIPSQAFVQQKGSCAHTVVGHGPQFWLIGPSCMQTSWHIGGIGGPQVLLLHWPLQQSAGVMQGTPSGWHWNPQSPLVHVLVQHWLGTMQGVPSG
jgi:hypothetical protein